MRTRIYDLAASALSNVDKDKSVKTAAAIAAALAENDRHPRLRRIAGLVSEALQPGDQVPRPLAATQPSHNGQTRTSTEVPRPSSDPVKPCEEAVLRGTMDASNCGGYGFSLYNSFQLSVGKLGTDGAVGGFYDLTVIPPGQWTALMGRSDPPALPVRIRRVPDAVTVSVGAVPASGGPVAWPLR